MKARDCERHERTVALARAGQADAHLEACPHCRDAALVARVLSDLAERTRLPAPNFDAARLFRRSQFAARWREQEDRMQRATRPLRLAHALVGAALVAGAIGLAWAAGAPALEGTAVTSGVAQLVFRVALWPLAAGVAVALAATRILWIED